MEKNFKSIFSPKKEIDICCHITEVILNNKLEWQSKKEGKDKKPRCDFWSKEKSSENSEYKKLQNDFKLEVSYVKNLCKIFSPQVVLEYVKDRGIITFRYLTVDKQKTVIYNLYQNELSHKKEMKKLAEKTKKSTTKHLDFDGTKTKQNKFTDLL